MTGTRVRAHSSWGLGKAPPAVTGHGVNFSQGFGSSHHPGIGPGLARVHRGIPVS